MRKLLLSLVVLHVAFVAATVRSEHAPFYYYWAGRKTVYLWLNENDTKPVIATQGSRGWTLNPPTAKTDPAWAGIVKDNSPNSPSGKDPWEVFLNRLRDEQPNSDLAKVKPLDLQVYLRIRSPEHVLITYAADGTPPAINTTVDFTKRGGKWSADRLDALAKLATERPNEIKAVLGVQDTPPTDAPKLEALWGAWIDQFSGNDQPGAKLSPVQARAVWQERLTDADWLRRTNLAKLSAQASPTQTQSPATDQNPVTTPVQPSPFYTQLWFLFLVIVIFLVVLTFTLRPKWLFERQPSKGRKGKAKEEKRERLKKLKERGGAVYDIDDDGTSADDGALDGVYEEHLHVVEESFRASLARLREQVETDKTRLTKALGINGMQADEARDVITAGLAVKDCYSALLKVPQVHADTQHGLYPQNRSKQQWLAGLSESIHTVTKELNTKTEETVRLGDDVKRKNELIALRERELKATEQELSLLQQQKVTLESSLDAATRRNEDSQTILDGIRQAAAVAKNLQQGLRYYLDKVNDATTTGVIAALINYSLSKLCQGYVDGDDALVNAMLVNLYNIAVNLQDVNGFKIALQEMEKHYTDIQSLNRRLVTTDMKDFDDRVFQMLLKYLREHGRVDLSPFYFASDQDKKVHVAS